MTTIKNLLSLALILASVSVFSQSNELKVGDLSQPFSAKADNGKTWKSKKLLGKKNLVVYFYPAAMTGGCTKQACAYRDDKTTLEAYDAVVVGVSGDEVKNLKLFKEAHMLNFDLLSDPKGEIAKSFGVPLKEGEKSIEREIKGIKYQLSRGVTTSRWTFVIDKKGKLVYKSTQVNAAEDSKAVIDVLKDL